MAYLPNWERLAGSLYASLTPDGQVLLREWDSPEAPVWRSSARHITDKLEWATDNVDLGGRQGDGVAVTVQQADIDDLMAWLAKHFRKDGTPR